MIETAFTVAAALDDVRDALRGGALLAACLPGASVRQIGGENAYAGRVSWQHGAYSIAGWTVLQAVDEDEDEQLGSFHLHYREPGKTAVGDARVECQVASVESATRVVLRVEYRVIGCRADAAAVERAAREVLDDVAARVKGGIREHGAQRRGNGRPLARPAVALGIAALAALVLLVRRRQRSR